MPQVKLPFSYQGVNPACDCKILGWNGLKLQTKIDGRIWTLSESDKRELLGLLGLKDEDIPGHPVIPVVERGLKGLAALEIEDDGSPDLP
jgi:hypothetical protein